jgi:hypothetical protein
VTIGYRREAQARAPAGLWRERGAGAADGADGLRRDSEGEEARPLTGRGGGADRAGALTPLSSRRLL